MSSILSGDVPPEGNEEQKPPPSKFGNLRPNKKARNKREKVRFFDSADWAMRQQNEKNGDTQEQPQQDDDVLRVSQISSIVDSEQPVDNGNSSLISGSPMAQGGDSGSPLAGQGGQDDASPLAG
ncbi:hypothetical protein M9Y10_001082 [Tritrichomonas musculus]|uniref:Uncharacterized protein n=1 Tax=Tritrichomonas musculus TaxID=1915356 RepID=A0ABR2L966_9EUKA